MKTYSSFSKIYERLYPIARFVGDLGAPVDADKDNRGYDKQRFVIKNIS
jgi:iron uptake system EfeUOB component EfeO/EfeM